MSDEVTIVWDTAEVTVSQDGSMHLEVELSDEPSSFWTNELQEFEQQRHGPPRTDWWIDSPRFKKLGIGGVKPGTEAAVRTALDEIVSTINERAVRARAAQDKQSRVDEAEAEAREKRAREMTERFRAKE